MNASTYQKVTEHLLSMSNALDQKDQDSFVKAMRSRDVSNMITGNAELTAAYVKVYRRAINLFIGQE